MQAYEVQGLAVGAPGGRAERTVAAPQQLFGPDPVAQVLRGLMGELDELRAEIAKLRADAPPGGGDVATETPMARAGVASVLDEEP